MKMLLLTTAALVALAAPAYAADITSGCDPSGSFCYGSPGSSAPDSDDVKMYNNGALKDVTSLFGSTTATARIRPTAC
jgi:opacity protein-like surface antigen